MIPKDEVLDKLEPFCILKGFRGSIAHGTYEETVTHDDKDIMGIFVAPDDVIFGIRNIETVERMMGEKLSEKRTTVWDVVFYSLKKYLNLILKQNPNVISLLWLEEKFYLKKTKWGQLLIDSRSKLLSKQVYKSFLGYARGQLGRMTRVAPTGKLGAKRKELVEKFGYDCYDDETTEFLTEVGWKGFDDVGSRRLATVDITTGNLEWQFPISRVDKLYTGMLYRIDSMSSRVVVTPGHNMLVSPARRQRGNNFSTVYKEGMADWRLLSLKSILGGRRSHYHIRKVVNGRGEELTGFTDDFLRLSGLYISEGTTIFRRGLEEGIRISQKKSGKAYDMINGLMAAFPLRRYVYEKETVWTLIGEIAHRIHNAFGHGSKYKSLPVWCYQLSTRQVEVLFDAMLAGDGTYKVKNDVYYTSSVQLASDTHAMLTSAGILASCDGPYSFVTTYGPCVMYQVVRTHVGRGITCTDFHGILPRGAEVTRNKRGSVKELDASGRRVVCFEVPNGTLITRNGGNVAIHGNCKNAGHLIRLLKMGIEALTLGELIVERPDNNMLLEIKRGEWELKRVLEYADSLFKLLDEALVRSPLPVRVEEHFVNSLCMEITEEFYGVTR